MDIDKLLEEFDNENEPVIEQSKIQKIEKLYQERLARECAAAQRQKSQKLIWLIPLGFSVVASVFLQFFSR